MRIDEILKGITKLAIKNKKSIFSPWRADSWNWTIINKRFGK